LDQKLILFDWMETLIDLVEIPGEKEYALWAFQGSGVEKYWQGENHFINEFRTVRKILNEKLPYHKEYGIQERFNLIVEMNRVNYEEKEKKEIVSKLVTNYWHTYKNKCFVSDEVISILKDLYEKYSLGVVSNFIVEHGIEELIAELGIQKYFKCIVTSINTGWRKPYPRIYNEALRKAGFSRKEKVIFIGDDYVNDYITPRKLGMKAFLYDRYERYLSLDDRFTSFFELPKIIP